LRSGYRTKDALTPTDILRATLGVWEHQQLTRIYPFFTPDFPLENPLDEKFGFIAGTRSDS